MINGTKITTKSKFWGNDPTRVVTYLNGGIQVNLYWFTWDDYFDVNVIVD